MAVALSNYERLKTIKMADISNKYPDTIFSTYWWDINLDETQKQRRLRGYSAFVGNPERTNKLILLKVKYKMFLNQGYLNRSTSIEIHRRAGGIIDLRNDPIIVTLYPDHYLFNDITSPEAKGTCRTLDQIYEIRKGDPTAKFPNLNYAKSTVSKDDKADPLKRMNEFRTLDELVNECQAMQQRGMAPGQVQHFYKSVIEKKPHLK